MTDENERDTDNQSEEQQPEETAPEAGVNALQEDAQQQQAADTPEIEEPAGELALEESPMAAADEPQPSERDESEAADQEAEVEARLGEGELIEEPPAEQAEAIEDVSPAEVEQEAAAVETSRQRPARDRVEDRAARTSDEGTPDFSQVPQPDGDSDGRAWYVVHCYSGYENKVRHNLEQRIESMGMKDKIFDVVVPTEEEIEVKEGKRRTVERRVFPGYILVNMIMGEESWYVVRNTPGVTSFVGQGNTPLPLRPEEVSQIVKRMEAEAPRIKVSFRQGERVRIVDGPFNDFRGTVSEIDMERAKVRVMVNFFGRETPVELDFLQVEKA